jgi:hypothetical protein
VNYEDRTDLLPPEQVVSAVLLSKLRLIPDVAQVMALSLDTQERSVSSAACEAIVMRVVQDTAPGSGAPAGQGLWLMPFSVATDPGNSTRWKKLSPGPGPSG